MAKAKKEKANQNEDFLTKEAKEGQATAEAYTLDIPEDEIWTYQVEGLQAPHVNLPFKNAGIKKVIFVVALLIAIGVAIYLSVRAVHKDPYEFKALDDGTYELVKFNNPGDVTEITFDYFVDNETGEKDYSKPISVIDEFAINCDETITKITFGKDVREIHGASIYSCWWINYVDIDDENPYYCDIDGVVYTKDLTELVFFPTAYYMHLKAINGYDEFVNQWFGIIEDSGATYDEEFWAGFDSAVRTYVVPSTVTKIGQLALAYSKNINIYIPEGVKTMGSMAVFKNESLQNLYSYTTDEVISDTTYKAIDSMANVYDSLPEGLEYIGSDCFYYCRQLGYMYVPASVKYIGHHAFWDMCYKDGKEIKGMLEINLGADEDTFKSETETGDQWRPWYDYMLFKKSIDINYSAARR
ncbi:MAG: leucine-rich repeat domain-containing protein [Eubacterium sp.]|nr:leucine-rich repeat domain-containing protein [Eubacterium sp.]